MDCIDVVQSLSKKEQNSILSVLQRDEHLRLGQDKKISELKQEIQKLRTFSILRAGDDQAKMCLRCRGEFGFLFNRGTLCPICRFKVCNQCQQVMFNGTWLCIMCYKQRQLKWLTGEWATFEQNPMRKWASGSDLIRASMKLSIGGTTSIDLDEQPTENVNANNNKTRKPARNAVSAPDQGKARGVEYPKEGDQLKLSQLFGVLRTKKPEEVEKEHQVKRVSSRRYSESDSDSSSSSDVEEVASSIRNTESPNAPSLTESEIDAMGIDSPQGIKVGLGHLSNRTGESSKKLVPSNKANFRPKAAPRSPQPATRSHMVNTDDPNQVVRPKARPRNDDRKSMPLGHNTDRDFSRVEDDGKVSVSKSVDVNLGSDLQQDLDKHRKAVSHTELNLQRHVARTKESLDKKKYQENKMSKSQNSLDNISRKKAEPQTENVEVQVHREQVLREQVLRRSADDLLETVSSNGVGAAAKHIRKSDNHLDKDVYKGRNGGILNKRVKSKDNNFTESQQVTGVDHISNSNISVIIDQSDPDANENQKETDNSDRVSVDASRPQSKCIMPNKIEDQMNENFIIPTQRAGSPYSFSMDSLPSSHPSPTFRNSSVSESSLQESSDCDSLSRFSHPELGEFSGTESVAREGSEENFDVEEISKVRFQRISRKVAQVGAMAKITRSPRNVSTGGDIEVGKWKTQSRGGQGNIEEGGGSSQTISGKSDIDKSVEIVITHDDVEVAEDEIFVSEEMKAENTNSRNVTDLLVKKLQSIDKTKQLSENPRAKSTDELSWYDEYGNIIEENETEAFDNFTTRQQWLRKKKGLKLITSSVASDSERRHSEADSIEGMIDDMAKDEIYAPVEEYTESYTRPSVAESDASFNLTPITPISTDVFERKSGNYRFAYISDDNLDADSADDDEKDKTVHDDEKKLSQENGLKDPKNRNDADNSKDYQKQKLKAMGSLDILIFNQGDFVDGNEKDVELEQEFMNALKVESNDSKTSEDSTMLKTEDELQPQDVSKSVSELIHALEGASSTSQLNKKSSLSIIEVETNCNDNQENESSKSESAKCEDVNKVNLREKIEKFEQQKYNSVYNINNVGLNNEMQSAKDKITSGFVDGKGLLEKGYNTYTEKTKLKTEIPYDCDADLDARKNSRNETGGNRDNCSTKQKLKDMNSLDILLGQQNLDLNTTTEDVKLDEELAEASEHQLQETLDTISIGNTRNNKHIFESKHSLDSLSDQQDFDATKALQEETVERRYVSKSREKLKARNSLDILLDQQGDDLDIDSENVELDAELIAALEQQFQESMLMKEFDDVLEVQPDMNFLGVQHNVKGVGVKIDKSNIYHYEKESNDEESTNEFDQVFGGAVEYMDIGTANEESKDISSSFSMTKMKAIPGYVIQEKGDSSDSDMLSIIDEEDEMSDNLSDDSSNEEESAMAKVTMHEISENQIEKNVNDDQSAKTAEQIDTEHLDAQTNPTVENIKTDMPKDINTDNLKADNETKLETEDGYFKKTVKKTAEGHIKGKLFTKARDIEKKIKKMVQGGGSSRVITSKKGEVKNQEKYKKVHDHWLAVEHHEADILDLEDADDVDDEEVIVASVKQERSTKSFEIQNDGASSDLIADTNLQPNIISLASVKAMKQFLGTETETMDTDVENDPMKPGLVEEMDEEIVVEVEEEPIIFERKPVMVTMTDHAFDILKKYEGVKSECEANNRDVLNETDLNKITNNEQFSESTADDIIKTAAKELNISEDDKIFEDRLEANDSDDVEFRPKRGRSICRVNKPMDTTDIYHEMKTRNEQPMFNSTMNDANYTYEGLSIHDSSGACHSIRDMDTDDLPTNVWPNHKVQPRISISEASCSSISDMELSPAANYLQNKNGLGISITDSRTSCHSISNLESTISGEDIEITGKETISISSIEDDAMLGTHESVKICRSILDGESSLFYNVLDESEMCNSIDERSREEIFQDKNVFSEDVEKMFPANIDVEYTNINENEKDTVKELESVNNSKVLVEGHRSLVRLTDLKREFQPIKELPRTNPLFKSSLELEIEHGGIYTPPPLSLDDPQFFKAPEVPQKIKTRTPSSSVSSSPELTTSFPHGTMDSPKSGKLPNSRDSPQTISECSISKDDSGHVSGGSRGTTPEHKRTDSNFSQSSIPSTLSTVTDKSEEDDDIDKVIATMHTKYISGSRGNLLSTIADSRESIASYYSDAGDIAYSNIPVTGEILFSVNYNYKTSMLEVAVKQCRDIAVADTRRHKTDPYVKTYLLPDKTRSGKRKTKVKKHTTSPTFDETLRYSISKSELENRTLWVTVWHNDRLGRNSFLGEVTINFDYYKFDDPSSKWYPLQERIDTTPSSMMVYKGDLSVCIRYVPADKVNTSPSHKGKQKKESGKGQLQVMVKEARNLTAVRSNGFSDPFCKGYLLPERHKSSKQKTVVVKKDCNPVWNHTFIFEDVTLMELRERCLELTIWDYEKISSNDFLGGVRLNLGTGVSQGKPIDWMDARGEEMSMWQAMLDRPNCWIDGALILRPNMEKRKY